MTRRQKSPYSLEKKRQFWNQVKKKLVDWDLERSFYPHPQSFVAELDHLRVEFDRKRPFPISVYASLLEKFRKELIKRHSRVYLPKFSSDHSHAPLWMRDYQHQPMPEEIEELVQTLNIRIDELRPKKPLGARFHRQNSLPLPLLPILAASILPMKAYALTSDPPQEQKQTESQNEPVVQHQHPALSPSVWVSEQASAPALDLANFLEENLKLNPLDSETQSLLRDTTKGIQKKLSQLFKLAKEPTPDAAREVRKLLKEKPALKYMLNDQGQLAFEIAIRLKNLDVIVEFLNAKIGLDHPNVRNIPLGELLIKSRVWIPLREKHPQINLVFLKYLEYMHINQPPRNYESQIIKDLSETFRNLDKLPSPDFDAHKLLILWSENFLKGGKEDDFFKDTLNKLLSPYKNNSVKILEYELITGMSAFGLAIWTNNTFAAQKLIEHDGRTLIYPVSQELEGQVWWPASGDKPWHFALLFENYGMLELFLKKHPQEINDKNIDGETALHTAARDLSPNTVRWLLDHGADLSIVNPDGLFPLDIAIEKGNVEMIQIFAEHKNPWVATGIKILNFTFSILSLRGIADIAGINALYFTMVGIFVFCCYRTLTVKRPFQEGQKTVEGKQLAEQKIRTQEIQEQQELTMLTHRIEKFKQGMAKEFTEIKPKKDGESPKRLKSIEIDCHLMEEGRLALILDGKKDEITLYSLLYGEHQVDQRRFRAFLRNALEKKLGYQLTQEHDKDLAQIIIKEPLAVKIKFKDLRDVILESIDNFVRPVNQASNEIDTSHSRSIETIKKKSRADTKDTGWVFDSREKKQKEKTIAAEKKRKKVLREKSLVNKGKSDSAQSRNDLKNDLPQVTSAENPVALNATDINPETSVEKPKPAAANSIFVVNKGDRAFLELDEAARQKTLSKSQKEHKRTTKTEYNIYNYDEETRAQFALAYATKLFLTHRYLSAKPGEISAEALPCIKHFACLWHMTRSFIALSAVQGDYAHDMRHRLAHIARKLKPKEVEIAAEELADKLPQTCQQLVSQKDATLLKDLLGNRESKEKLNLKETQLHQFLENYVRAMTSTEVKDAKAIFHEHLCYIFVSAQPILKIWNDVDGAQSNMPTFREKKYDELYVFQFDALRMLFMIVGELKLKGADREHLNLFLKACRKNDTDVRNKFGHEFKKTVNGPADTLELSDLIRLSELASIAAKKLGKISLLGTKFSPPAPIPTTVTHVPIVRF